MDEYEKVGEIWRKKETAGGGCGIVIIGIVILAWFQGQGQKQQDAGPPSTEKSTVVIDGTKGGKQKAGPPVADRVVLVDQTFPGWERGLDITLDKVELLTNYRMRWSFTYTNRTGADIRVSAASGAFVLDDLGNKYKFLAGGTVGEQDEGLIVNGQRWKYWIEFQRPVAEASELYCTIATGIPRMTVRITGTKSEGSVTSGRVKLFTKVAVSAGVQAWVEVGGERKAEWPVGAKEVTLDLPTGTHQLTVRAAFTVPAPAKKGKPAEPVRQTRVQFDRRVTVEADKTVDVSVDP